MSRYLNEIRLGEEKQSFRDIIRDVRREFDLSSRHRPVPHITLFGPYNTANGHRAKKRVQRVLSQYQVVPYRVTGFDVFYEPGVVYAKVEPSEQLQKMRDELAGGLIPLTSYYRPWDTDEAYEFHITIATGVGEAHDRILNFVRSKYNLDMKLYAKRVAALDGRDMMWEWDLPRQKELSSGYATSKQSWKKTERELDAVKESESGKGGRLISKIRQRIS